MLHQCLIHPNMSVREALEEAGAYLDIEDMARPLKLMYDSLLATGDESVANARLLDLLRQVGCVCIRLLGVCLNTVA